MELDSESISRIEHEEKLIEEIINNLSTAWSPNRISVALAIYKKCGNSLRLVEDD